MKCTKYLAGAGLAIAVGFAAPLAWGQYAPVAPSVSSTVTTTTVTTTTTARPLNPDDPEQFPPSAGTNSHEGAVKGAYVDLKIAEAKEQGRDTSAAISQSLMGRAALAKGQSDAAAQHFDAALRSVGVMPNWPGKNVGAGEMYSEHAAIP